MNDAKLKKSFDLLRAALEECRANLSVHDYIGMDDAEMLDLVGRFRDEVGRLLEAG